MPPPPSGGAQNLTLNLVLNTVQPLKQLAALTKAASAVFPSSLLPSTQGLATGLGGMLPSPITGSAMGTLGAIGTTGQQQLGSMAQRAADSFFGRNSNVSKFVGDVRRDASNYEAESATSTRTKSLAEDFARQGIPVDKQFLSGFNSIIFQQEQAAQAASRDAADVSYDARADRDDKYEAWSGVWDGLKRFMHLDGPKMRR